MSEEKKQGLTPISELGEFGLIEHLTGNNFSVNSSTVKAVGDDAAVIDHENDVTLTSTDMLVEGVHFDLSYMPLMHLGYKAAIVNFSDIYAMNGHPKQLLVSVAMSNRFTLESIEEIYQGIYAACKQYGVDLVGGDTTSSTSGLILSLTVLGIATPNLMVVEALIGYSIALVAIENISAKDNTSTRFAGHTASTLILMALFSAIVGFTELCLLFIGIALFSYCYLRLSYNTTVAKKIRPAITVFFGLIHGLGFSNYFKMMVGKEEDKLFPLIEFALGIEIAQVIIVLAILLLGALILSIKKIKKQLIIVTHRGIFRL